MRTELAHSPGSAHRTTSAVIDRTSATDLMSLDSDMQVGAVLVLGDAGRAGPFAEAYRLLRSALEHACAADGG